MEEDKTSLLDLYLTFFRIGAVTFGGGYAMLPILNRDIVEGKHWMDNDKIMDYYAVSQGLPGIIAVNVAAFIGYARRKVPGVVAAALGVVSPCVVIITVIAACLNNFRDNLYVSRALAGISVTVAALIVSTIIGLWKKGVKDIPTFLIFLAVLLLSYFTSLSPIICVVGSAVIGILLKKYLVRDKGGSGK